MEHLRVLITDDEPGMRLGVERTLSRFQVRIPDVNDEVGFTVEQAESGEQALRIIEDHPPDILLLDYKLPGMSGLDVLDRLSPMKLDMLTIMITAYASIETAILATKRGAYDFLAKPFTPDEIRSIIRKTAARLILAKQTRRLAEEKRKLRFQFIRVLGHELKAPLNAIEGYLQIMQERTLGQEISAYDDIVKRSVIRIEGMRRLIADLLDMTRIESGTRRRQIAEVDLVSTAHGAIETVAPQAREKDLTVQVHAAAPVQMVADPEEITIILNNLVSNAVKYNRPGGRVDISIQRQDKQVVLQVSDTGIGMTAEDVGKLFKEFVRIKNDKTREILGSGLGLSIVKRLAHLYNGDVSVRSEPDSGSTFTVTLEDFIPEETATPSPAGVFERS